jgi:fibronectin type 3 domain-containing protein
MNGYDADTLYAPTKLTAEAINETTALLAWDEVDGAYRYNIYLGDSLVAKDVAETSYLMTNLEVGKEYCYNVTATYLERESAHSEPACVTTEEGMTFASPANVVATPTNDSTIVLTWNHVEKADSYKVYRGTELLATVTDTTYTEEGLEAETQYCYVVTSSLKTIESVASEEVCATTLEYVEPEQPADTTTLAAPTNLRATIRQDVPGFKYKYEITMAWDAVEGAKGYEVYVNTADTTGFQMGYTNGTAYVAGTNKESSFEFYVIAFDDSIVSAASEPCTVTIVDDAIEEMNASFNIYPNPVNDKLVIETEEIVKEVFVYDIYGRRQELSAVSYQPSAIDVSGLNSGVYFVKVVTANGEIVKRFVKE